MSNLALTEKISSDAIEKVLLKGDLSTLTPQQKLSYYKAVCDSVGLNPLTKPFEYIVLSGKEVLYATRACTDQLRNVHKISIKVTDRKVIEDVYVVTAQARSPEREDESTGAVPLKDRFGKPLTGDALANAYMKAETKAKRRATLSICGLGLLDETEVETIPDAKKTEQPKQVVTQNEAEDFFDDAGKQEPVVESLPSQDPGSYVIQRNIGKPSLKGRKLSEISQDVLESQFNYWSAKNPEGVLAQDIGAIGKYLERIA